MVYANIHEYKQLVDSLIVYVGKPWQGVYLVSKDDSRHRINDVVKILAEIPTSDVETRRHIVNTIRFLEQESLNLASSKSLSHKVAMAVREYVSSFFYNRQEVLNQLEFPGHVLATSKAPYRLLVLKGQQGSVACRVRGDSSATIPRVSREWVVEGATRSFLRMLNLKTARGITSGAKMMGPCDYFGNVEAPHKHAYTIDIDENDVPAFLINSEGPAVNTRTYTIMPHEVSTTINATWHKGTDSATKAIQTKYENSRGPVIGHSLFPNAGILEIDGLDTLTLKKFDAREMDLSPFRARLVDNKVPFTITSDPISSSDDYRAVSYMYEPNYACDQVNNGGGLFLETHKFAQTITPLDIMTSGFVTLGRWVDASKTKLELIAVEIPFGHTLIIDKECIHGDTNLVGMFMMCMTSNHRTMSSADTVFLKNRATLKNFSIDIEGGAQRYIAPLVPPIALSQAATAAEQKEFSDTLQRHNVIFNPIWRL